MYRTLKGAASSPRLQAGVCGCPLFILEGAHDYGHERFQGACITAAIDPHLPNKAHCFGNWNTFQSPSQDLCPSVPVREAADEEVADGNVSPRRTPQHLFEALQQRRRGRGVDDVQVCAPYSSASAASLSLSSV